MDERGGVSVFIGLIVTVIVVGFTYTIIHGVLSTFSAFGPNTSTMQFLNFVLGYLMLPALLIVILWYLTQMQKSRYGGI